MLLLQVHRAPPTEGCLLLCSTPRARHHISYIVDWLVLSPNRLRQVSCFSKVTVLPAWSASVLKPMCPAALPQHDLTLAAITPEEFWTQMCQKYTWRQGRDSLQTQQVIAYLYKGKCSSLTIQPISQASFDIFYISKALPGRLAS